jgi:putative transcriptional regulator
MINHHPDEEVLAAYSSGTLPQGMSLLVASHLTLCASCRSFVECCDDVGGNQLEEPCRSKLKSPCIDATLVKLDGCEADMPIAPVAQRGCFPSPILHALGGCSSQINWKFRLPGVHEHTLECFEGEHVSLLRARPGSRMLAHTHDGDEATLILQGSMQDLDVVYNKGDVAMADHDDDHCPQIVGDDTCICLIVMSGNMKFTGPLSRALNIFSG